MVFSIRVGLVLATVWLAQAMADDCTPVAEMTPARMAELCPDYITKAGIKGTPIYGPDARICGNNPQCHPQLHASMANDLFGGNDYPVVTPHQRDCKAWCLYDIVNPINFYRWNNRKQCWKFFVVNGNIKSCQDSTFGESDAALTRQGTLCSDDVGNFSGCGKPAPTTTTVTATSATDTSATETTATQTSVTFETTATATFETSATETSATQTSATKEFVEVANKCHYTVQGPPKETLPKAFYFGEDEDSCCVYELVKKPQVCKCLCKIVDVRTTGPVKSATMTDKAYQTMPPKPKVLTLSKIFFGKGDANVQKFSIAAGLQSEFEVDVKIRHGACIPKKSTKPKSAREANCQPYGCHHKISDWIRVAEPEVGGYTGWPVIANWHLARYSLQKHFKAELIKICTEQISKGLKGVGCKAGISEYSKWGSKSGSPAPPCPPA